MWILVNFHLVSVRYPYASCYTVQLSKKLVWKIYFEPKKDSNSQEGHGWMIEGGQLLFDRTSDPLVVMELIVYKCSRMCKGPECQWFSNALNLIDGDFEDGGDDTGDEYESD